MIDRVWSLVEVLRARPGLLALAVFCVAAAGGVAGLSAYRTYDYVQHDNDFCVSCHLMEEPFEEFARSAHRGLGCKACHQPTIVERSAMGLTQVVDRPIEIEVHADVPNERCAECHIEGDPETWESVRNSAGHLTHLDSDSLDLKGLMCVECHSSSVHQFTSTDQTCGQSDCHDETKIQLGRMGDFTIHCTACHSFLCPVEGVE